MMDLETRAMMALERVRWFRIKTLMTLYVIIGVMTFGYAATARQTVLDARRCYLMITTVKEDPELGTKATITRPDTSTKERTPCEHGMPASIAGVFAAAMWPLYWSWELWAVGNEGETK
jgi:hypothetical protein